MFVLGAFGRTVSPALKDSRRKLTDEPVEASRELKRCISYPVGSLIHQGIGKTPRYWECFSGFEGHGLYTQGSILRS